MIGGGPAGCVIARRLAELGHETLALDRDASAVAPRAESLAPSILPILESLNLSGVLEAAVFRREERAFIRWGSDRTETKSFEPASMLVEMASSR